MKKEMVLAPVQEFLTLDYLSDNTILNLLPSAVYICDQMGVIQKYNEQAVKLWGRRPVPGDRNELFCGAHKLLRPDGSKILPCENPVADCLSDGQPRKNIHLVMERPDRSRIHVRLDIVPIRNNEGNQIGVINCFNEVTEEIKNDHYLINKGKELKDFIENASIGLHRTDSDGIIKWANKAVLDFLGYPENEFIGHHISEFHVNKDNIGNIINGLKNNENIKEFESELRCRDGSIKYVQVTSNVYRENGDFIHTRWFTIDITEQKKLFNQIQENEARHRMILKNLPAAIYTCDKDGYVSYYNDEAARLWGREPEIGKDLWCGSWKITTTEGNSLPLKECPMARCLKEGKPVRNEKIIIIKPNGEKRFIHPHPEPLFDKDGNITGAVNMLVDLTDVNETEKTLRESESRFRELAASLEKTIEEKTNDLLLKNNELKKSEERYHKMVEEVEDYAIIFLDENGFILNWNKGAEKIKGYKESEIIGKNFQTFYLSHDRENGLPTKLINQAKQYGKAVHEGWRLRNDGTKFWGSIVLTALHNNKNEIIGFSKVTRDLTEKKLAEDKLKEYTSQLKFQNEQLEQFAYAASHDMKEPLRKILFYNNHLLETVSSTFQDKEREYLNRSINAARRMERLINDLLEYSKAASVAHGFEPVDLNEIIDETLLSYKDVIDEKEAVIEYQLLPVISGVPFQLRQLIDNLISNSIKYRHPARPPRIKIKSEIVPGNAKIDLEPERNYHRIEICDNGIGFEPEYSEKIFELFQRLGTIKYSGTGVGLALCKRIAQNHHGTIIAKGELNVGACFEVYIPV